MTKGVFANVLTDAGESPRVDQPLSRSSDCHSSDSSLWFAVIEAMEAMHEDFMDRWEMPPVLPISLACVRAGRLGEDAAATYCDSLRAVWKLGPSASAAQVVDVLEKYTAQGAGGVLFAAEICQLYSDWVAQEAFKRVCRWPSLKGAAIANKAKRSHKERMRLAARALQRAKAQSSV